ncbi:MAG: fibronectin type III domain-containing protein [Treponema sp.]|nr:fibronectin type III domain-containing protein [Treponema sp.]
MIKRLLITIILILILVTCKDFGNDNTSDNTNNTFIVFDNTQGICAVTVYDFYQRRDSDIVTVVSAGKLSKPIEWIAGEIPFYFEYHTVFNNGFILNYIPSDVGRGQTTARIDANKTTEIIVPKLEDTVSSLGEIFTNNSFILIQNNSSFSIQLHRGFSPLSPDNSKSSTVVNTGEQAQYTIEPNLGSASNYKIFIGADYISLSDVLTSFEAGCVYTFIFTGSTPSLVSEVKLILENVANNPISLTALDAPVPLTVIVNPNILTVNWTAVQGAESYEIYISETQTPPETPIKTVFGTTTVLSGLINKTVYYIWIKAVNSEASSEFSARACGIPWSSYEVPAIPKRPVIIPGINQLTVIWEDTGGALTYEVYINKTPDIPSTPTISTSELNILLENLEDNIIYYIWIRAVNNRGKSNPSEPEAGTTKIPTSAPSTPICPSLFSGNKTLTVSWQTVELASAYEVWYGTSNDTSQAKKFGNDTKETVIVITGLENGSTYYVWIKAKNLIGTSSFSPVASAKLIDNVGTVSLIAGNEQLIVNWTYVAGADQYEIFYNTKAIIPEKPALTVSSTTATFSNLTNGTTYYIWVRAINANGSITSESVSGKPLGVPGVPNITPEYKQLSLSWTAVVGADRYEVYIGIETPTTLAVTTTGTTVVINELIGGMSYRIRLRALNTNGISDFGPIASGIPDAYLSPGLYRNGNKIGNQNLSTSLSYISSNAATGDKFIISLGGNESIAPANLSYSGRTIGITLIGYENERTITLSSNGSMFTVNVGVTLTLDENITLLGRSTNNNSLVYLSNGSLIINDSAKIRGNNSGTADGGGIYISSGTLTMNGGVISENTASGGGGGISISSGSIIINAGTISRNKSINWQGGGIDVKGGTIIMKGGNIRENSSNYGGGICLSKNGSMIMYGGIINGNTNFGVYTWTGWIGSIQKFLPNNNEQSSGIIYGYEVVGNDVDGVQLKNNAGAIDAATRLRFTTAWETDHIDSTTGRGLSASGNPPFGQ